MAQKSPRASREGGEIYHKTSLELNHPIVVVGGGEMSRAELNEPPPNEPSGYFKPHDELHTTYCRRDGYESRTHPSHQPNTISSRWVSICSLPSGELSGNTTTGLPSKPSAVRYLTGTA